MKESKVAGREAVYVPDHPKANSSGYILKARFVVERYLGRQLTSEEHVHHIDGNSSNNDLENLQIVSRSEHIKIHHKQGDLGRRKLDYVTIKTLRDQGLGYKRISKMLNYPRSSVRSAISVICGGD